MSRSTPFSFTSVISRTGTWCLLLFQVTSLFLGKDFQSYSKDLIGYWFVIWRNLTHAFQRFPLGSATRIVLLLTFFWVKATENKMIHAISLISTLFSSTAIEGR